MQWRMEIICAIIQNVTGEHGVVACHLICFQIRRDGLVCCESQGGHLILQDHSDGEDHGDGVLAMDEELDARCQGEQKMQLTSGVLKMEVASCVLKMQQDC
ncbi:hypothetical protein GUJ93_ZPchr0458g22367 [Zizania palustris]|uniref:Uncharacterized protein n=1 Tax=Zizania palustris TaxID=103762 RepID=A0A8J5VF26_ZIZPA|nr:hypothetical protein GUJ93_ZPchr0458g22367 [Zizania palustris]